MVSEQLDKKLRDNLRDPRSSMFTGEGMAANQLRSVLGSWRFGRMDGVILFGVITSLFHLF